MEVGEQRAWRRRRWIERQQGRSGGDPAPGRGGERELAGRRRDIVQPCHRPATRRRRHDPAQHGLAIPRRRHRQVERCVDTGISPTILEPQNHGRRCRPGGAQAGRDQLEMRRRPGHDVQPDVAGHGTEPGGAERIDVGSKAEVALDEGLDPRARPTRTAIAQAQHDAIPGLEVAVDDVDDQRFLVGALVTLLVEAQGQRLHRRRRLPGPARRCHVLGRGVVGGARVHRLEQPPVGIELEGRLEPAAIGQPGGADLVGEGNLGPLARGQAVAIGGDAAQERQAVGGLRQPAGRMTL